MKYRKMFINISKIDIWGFAGNQNISELTLSNIEYLGAHAFSDCANLQKVVIDGCNAILDCGCFSYCRSIEKISLNGVLKIGESAFSWCTNLKKIEIDVETIGEGAFFFCENLEKIVFSSKIKAIHDRAFCCCKNLKKVFFENIPQHFGQDIFMDNPNSLKVYFPSSLFNQITEQQSDWDFSNCICFFDGVV